METLKMNFDWALKESRLYCSKNTVGWSKFKQSKSSNDFQEKVTKELLEYHNRREGPILEGDEKYMMDFASKLKIIQGLIGQRYIGNLNLEKNTASKQTNWAGQLKTKI